MFLYYTILFLSMSIFLFLLCFYLFIYLFLFFFYLNELHSRTIINRRNVNMQFLRRAILMDEKTCAVGLREHVEHNRGILRFTRDFLQASIYDTTRQRQLWVICKIKELEFAISWKLLQFKIKFVQFKH